jgi:type IV fimbrial biogenesis protein FimT
MKTRSTAGFTIIELMVTLAVGAILLAVAVPNMRTFIQNSRLTSAANDLLRSLQMARTEAIKEQLPNPANLVPPPGIIVCATANPDAAVNALQCSYGTFSGWFVFADTNGNWQHDAGEPVIDRHALVDTSVTVRTDGKGIISYLPTGFSPTPAMAPPQNQTGNVVFCDMRGVVAAVGGSTARAVLIAQTGRPRVSSVLTDVNAALAATGGTCP